MANIKYKTFSEMSDEELKKELASIKTNYEIGRKHWERNWYDNNFFDDGYHYMFVSPDTGVAVDYGVNGNPFEPRRAIPKTSRQIRGISNLLLANRPSPVIYPMKLVKENFSDPQRYEQVKKAASDLALKVGKWVEIEWDDQELIQSKLPLMMILTAKHSVSYLKMWGNSFEERITSQVRDAFDIYLDGTIALEDNQVVIEVAPVPIAQILNNDDYDKDARKNLQPDNKYADSEVKQAYLKTKFGSKQATANTGTLLVKEHFIKEYATKKILRQIKNQKDGDMILATRSEGDEVFRQVTIAGNEILADKYVNLREFPYIPLQFEPGPLYQTPFMDRFKSSNKVLDNIVSRIEGYAHTMVAGKWWRRPGDNWKPTTDAGGQVIESSFQPVQLPMASVPSFMFNFVELLTSYIEEQGVTTSALGKLPNDVRSGIAIESLKSSEYANLTIQLEQTKLTVKKITERMLDIAHDYFITPQTAQMLENGTPNYFDVIGQRGFENNEYQSVVPISRQYKVDIQIQSGLGYTMEGRRANAKAVADYMLSLMQIPGLVPPKVVSETVKNLLQTYQYGGQSEILEAFNEWDAGNQMTEEQIMKMKVAMAETLKDAGVAGPEAEQKQIDTTKIGVAEAAKDLQT